MSRQGFPSTGERTIFQPYGGGTLARGRGAQGARKTTATTALEVTLVLTLLLLVTFASI